MTPDSRAVEFTGADAGSAAAMLSLVYDELRRLAMHRMAGEAPDHTLQPTALVHEAWIRLTGDNSKPDFASRAQFFAAAAESMRRILIESARRKSALKRGGKRERVDLDGVELAAETESETLLFISEALDKLAKEDPTAAEIVKLRFFAGLTLEEAGEVMGFTGRTAKRYWAYARAWLYEELSRDVS
jgi:RNA polymerase sigma factor (TIGR02999 family)